MLQDWDRLIMLLIGGGVAVYTGYGGWRRWQDQQLEAAIGLFLLSTATVVLPILLVLFGS